MTTATLHSVQFVDTRLDQVWTFIRLVINWMPDRLRSLIDESALRIRFLLFRRGAEMFVLDANTRKHWLFVGGRRLVIRLIIAALICG